MSEGKKCTECKVHKLLIEFPKHRNHKLGVGSACRPCNAKRANAWYYANHDKAKKSQREYNKRDPDRSKRNYLKRNYNLDFNQYKLMLKTQNNSCYICFKHESELKKGLVVDHNHTTGAVRALLCGSCNKALGQILEDANILKSMISYLEKFNGR